MEKRSLSSISVEHISTIGRCLVNRIIGQVLTVTDAVAKDDVQRKALKDLISNAVWNEAHIFINQVNEFGEALGQKLKEKNPHTTKPLESHLCIFDDCRLETE